MTAPTNWPNPERPGYPMFPDRDGWHMTTLSGATSPTVSFWRASEEVWKSGSSSYPPDYLAHHLRKYIGPVLTPAQITELLAGERDSDLHCALMDSVYVSGMKVGWNCAQDDDSARYNSIKEKILQDRIDSGVSFSERSKAIRNLGDAP